MTRAGDPGDRHQPQRDLAHRFPFGSKPGGTLGPAEPGAPCRPTSSRLPTGRPPYVIGPPAPLGSCFPGSLGRASGLLTEHRISVPIPRVSTAPCPWMGGNEAEDAPDGMIEGTW